MKAIIPRISYSCGIYGSPTFLILKDHEQPLTFPFSLTGGSAIQKEMQLLTLLSRLKEQRQHQHEEQHEDRMSFRVQKILFLLAVLLACYLAFQRFAASGNEPKVYTYETIGQVHTPSSSSPSPSQSNSENSEEEEEQKAPRVAVCLVGEARQFELTGPTIREHVLDVFKNADVFLNVPLTKDSFKLSLLAGESNFTVARVFTPSTIKESELYNKLLNEKNSPRARQGLLQYFSLVEGCWQMISDYERTQGIRYDWIVRTRLDTFWSDSIPVRYAKGAYTIPYGSDFGGLNDRLGVGDRNTSRAALIRMSILPFLYQEGYHRLNSERAFQKQLELQSVDVARETFPFCVLSQRRFPWPLARDTPPIASIQSRGDLNGAYCRPCTPPLGTNKASGVVSWLKRGDGWFPTAAGEVDLCDGSNGWEESWESVFDATVGEEAAKIRKRVGAMTISECVADLSAFQQQWHVWDGPSAEEICKLSSS